eukprot:8511621-Lingulodinium_polyedra.AAC.1
MDSLWTGRVLSMDSPWTRHGLPSEVHGRSMDSPSVNCPWYVHGQSMGKPWAGHGLSMFRPWAVAHGHFTDCPWAVRGQPKDNPWI